MSKSDLRATYSVTGSKGAFVDGSGDERPDLVAARAEVIRRADNEVFWAVVSGVRHKLRSQIESAHWTECGIIVESVVLQRDCKALPYCRWCELGRPKDWK